MSFMDKDFLLSSEAAKVLYHEHAEKMPIYDFHNHLSPKDIAEHRKFHDLTELWLEGDHYKWRAMRANGVEEKYVTGDAPAYEKFLKWAETVPKLAGSPLFHWTHLELQRYFNITKVLSPSTAKAIWDQTKQLMEGPGYDTVSLLEKMNVKVLCTTDDPADDLFWHKKIREDSTIPFKVLPSFRPDKYLWNNVQADARLCQAVKAGSINAALEKSLEYFCENGCKGSDHGFEAFPYYDEEPGFSDLIHLLGELYAKHGIVMQMHLGPIRNNVPSLMANYGPDAGADSVGVTTDPFALSRFLGELEERDLLPRTILYCLDPADNAKLCTMAGNFAPKVQFGAAWWFNDHIRGIRKQLDELMEQGQLAASVGMLTDSRSFTSFPRHEYFRRILCARLGELVESGEYPNDTQTLGKIVEDICYNNARNFF